jgi:hypothetical protein
VAEGGSKFKVLNNLSLTAAISGICLIILPKLAEILFQSVARI